MLSTDQIRAYVGAHEGLRLFPYRDTKGLLTIGYGCNLEQPGAADICASCGVDHAAVMSGATITEVQANDLFAHAVSTLLPGLRKLFPNFDGLSQNRQLALIDMGFAGIGTLSKFKHMIAAVNSGNFNEAAAQVLNSLWAHQVNPKRLAMGRDFRDAALLRAG